MKKEEFTACKEYASLDLVFSSYALFDSTVLETDDDAARAGLYGDAEKAARARFDAALAKLISEKCSDDDVKEIESELKALRVENKKRMDFFAETTDRLIAYEYVLNRIELSFSSDEELDDFLKTNPEEAFLNRIMIYLVGKKDKQLFGTRLNSIVGEIPIQMTKNKLFEYIDRAMTLYVGSDETAVDELLYMIRMAGLVYEPGDYLDEYPVLNSILADFDATDLDTINADEYNALKDRLYDMSGKIDYIMDYYINLERCVNDALALCITGKYFEDVAYVSQPVAVTLSSYIEGRPDEEGLIAFEGRIEGLSDRLQATMSKVAPPAEGQTPDDSDMDIAVVTRLLSNSLFAEIDPVFVKTKEVTKEMIKQKEDALFDDLTKVMSTSSKRVKKAIFAKILEKLPPFLTEQSEIENYIRTNLFNCRNKAEKCAVMAILIEMMED
ncbi:MAG: hypothetical protein K5639_07080 [Eubacterium sp.]|nr:hypothetical protein [Eubacterium sp.]